MSNNLSVKQANKKLDLVKTNLFISGLNENQKKCPVVNSMLDEFSDNMLSVVADIENFDGKFGKNISVYTNKNINKILLTGLGNKKDFNSEKARILGAKLSRYINSSKIDSVCLDAKSLLLNKYEYAQSLFEGLILGNYQFLNYKTADLNKNTFTSVCIFGEYNKKGVETGLIIGSSVNFARDLGNHPSNILTPTFLANEAKKIGKSKNMVPKIIDVKNFTKLGLGSFYGVARGSAEPAKLILIEYNGGNKKDKPLALVGKGLTFDSGGISIKPSPRMDEMKFDMCGSATVMGVLKAVSILQPKINLLFAIGSTENMPGGNAVKPGDILTAYNGKTIEVLNTDAEGRLVLADVLAYVEKNYKPHSIIDFATLTGSVLVALGDTASGIMGNDESLLNEIKKSSNKSHEKVWELPMWNEYSKDIKSKIADVKNLGRSRLAGTIAGGVFLQEFVNETPWVHMDIAGTAWGPKEPAYLPSSGATGVGVRLIYNLIEERIK